MSMFKGTGYAGQLKNGFGGTFKESGNQPKTFGTESKYGTNLGSRGDPASKKGSMLKKNYATGCKSCGGKM